MTLIITIITGVVFALLGMKKTFYPMWAHLFNVLLAIYLAVMLTPTVMEKFEIFSSFGSYSLAICLLSIAAAVFVVAGLLTFRFLTAVYCVSFPPILNNVGAAVLGFLTGFIAANFIIFVITITPISGNPSLEKFSDAAKASSEVNSYIISTCNVINKLSLQCDEKAAQKAVEYIIERRDQLAKTSIIVDVNTPEPNE